jgi:hypothetical protein
MPKGTRLLPALGLIGLAVGVPSHAADQPLLGKKLLIKNPPAGAAANKFAYAAKDPAVVVGAAGSAADPQCSGAGGGAILRVLASGGAGEVTKRNTRTPDPCCRSLSVAFRSVFTDRTPTVSVRSTPGSYHGEPWTEGEAVC